MDNVTGSCHCGAVSYQVNDEIRLIVNCHCTMCRQMNGTAFSSYVVVPEMSLELSGGEHLTEYSLTERASKKYCSLCGTPVLNVNSKYEDVCMLYLGGVVANESLTPALNIYCQSKLSWTDHVAALQALPQGVDGKS